MARHEAWPHDATTNVQPGLTKDEPTSAMDARGEHMILEQIKALAGACSTVVDTHQLINTNSLGGGVMTAAGHSR